MKFADVDTVFFGPMTGELGWACSRWHAWCRYRRFMEFPNCRSVAADYDWRYPLYADFIDEFIPLPKWFTDLGLEQDCYESVLPEAPAGGMMPQDIYTELLTYFKQQYPVDTTWTVRPPRGCNFIIQERAKQMWKTLAPSPQAIAYVDSILAGTSREVVIVSARARSRAENRNVPEFVWEEVVDRLADHFTVVITGTKHSSSLATKVGRDIINMIPRTGIDGLDMLIAFMLKARMSITSQSGPTLISLLCETPSYIVGHEAARHSKTENFLNTATMFREVPYHVYAGITPETMIQDISNFHIALANADGVLQNTYDRCHSLDKSTMISLLQEDVNLYGLSVENMRQEIIYGKPQG
jgi:hypothetical protein